ncbi:type II toxin-antitoxin system VapC family toxin [Faucicola boevrei]|uniref:type II toxin-antitoxin system VapC family toxin n=1 Tax=Faucicola boevrei TaxID=346665 RepID=UPI00036B0037|nr:type II toxin-antitoxin system VapC family toxin [Moraxella boevrei]
MNTLDTNILARFFIEDNNDKEAQKQPLIAKKLLIQPSYIALTVIMEFFWIIKKVYQLPKEDIITILTTLHNLRTVTFESPEIVYLPIRLYAQGMDFADTIHLLKTQQCDNFYTFDKNLIKKSALLSPHLTAKEPA